MLSCAYSRLPFDWHTPLGYCSALFVQFTADFAVLYSASTVMCFLVGSCSLFITIIRDITGDLTVLDCNESANNSKHSIQMQFRSVIEFYLDVKQMMNTFNDIYEPVITLGFLFARLGTKQICSLSFEFKSHKSNY